MHIAYELHEQHQRDHENLPGLRHFFSFDGSQSFPRKASFTTLGTLLKLNHFMFLFGGSMKERESAMSSDDWDHFLETCRPDIGFLQSSWWSRFMETNGWGHFGAVFKSDNKILGGARVLTYSYAPGKCFYYIPEAPVLPDCEQDAAQLFEATIDYVDAARRQDEETVSHLRIEPRWIVCPDYVKGCRMAGSWLEPRNTLQIDLNSSPDEILAQMRPRGRRHVRAARRHGVTVCEDMSPQGVSDFLDIYAETVQRQSLKGKDPEYFRSLCECLSIDGRGSLLFAELDGQRLAAGLIIYFGDRATYFFAGSRSLHRKAMAPYLLNYEAMCIARKLGMRWYDFYGISPPDREDDLWANITIFKRNFGGVEMNFVPAMDFIYDDAAYQEYRSA